MRKTTQGNATHLCEATQPDGRMQRCIRFEGHDGPHQTFVAEWSEGDVESRRRQYLPLIRISSIAATVPEAGAV